MPGPNTTSGTPLPRVESDLVQRLSQDEPNSLSAYEVCLDMEKRLATTTEVRFVRILGYLLIYSPNRASRNEIADCIHSSKEQSNVTDLGACFELNVITALKLYKSRKPESNEDSSRLSYEEMRIEVFQAPKSHWDAKDQALIRDNWHCVVTDMLDRETPVEVCSAADPLQQIPAAYTDCAHIIPDATYFTALPKDKGNKKLDYSASILAVLKRFHYDIESFNGEKVHSLTNVMTLQKDIHGAFDRLELYFEATSEENRYKVESFGQLPFTHHQRDFVTFSTKNPDILPIPSPESLALHATCCKVARFSGSAEYIDSACCDTEATGILSSDGHW